MSDESPSHVVDAVVRDAVDQQRERGSIPRTNEVRAYVQNIVERMDRQEAENKYRVFPKPEKKAAPKVERSSEAMENEFQRRLKRMGQEPIPGAASWTIERKPIDASALKEPETPKIVDKRLALAKRRMRTRLRLLRSKPDWYNKLASVNPIALQGYLGEAKQKEAESYIRQVIKDSNAVFGDWWKAPAKKLIFT